MLSLKTNGKRLPTWQRNRWSNGTSISWALSKCRMLSHVSFSDVLPTALYWARSDSEGHDMMKSYEMSSKVWQQFCFVRFFCGVTLKQEDGDNAVWSHSDAIGTSQGINQWSLLEPASLKWCSTGFRRKTTQLTIKIIKSKHHQTSLRCRSETKWDKVRQ